MTSLSQVEIQWLKASESIEDAAQLSALPAELVRSIYPELFNYGPCYENVLALGRYVTEMQQKTKSRAIPAEVFRALYEPFSHMQMSRFARRCALMHMDFVYTSNAAAVEQVTTNIDALVSQIIGPKQDSFFYFWSAIFYSVAGPAVYADHADPDFEETRHGIETAALNTIALDNHQLMSGVAS